MNPNPKCMLTLSSLRRWKKPRFGWGESDAREKWVEDLVVVRSNAAAFSITFFLSITGTSKSYRNKDHQES